MDKNHKRRAVVRVLARLTGGPARQACLLHEGLNSSFETYLVTGGLGVGEHDMGYLLSSAQNVFRIERMSREVSFWADFCSLLKLWRFLRRKRPSIVHTHTAKAGAIGRVAAWLAGVPVLIHTYHGHVFDGYFGTFKCHLYVLIERLLGLLTTCVIAISAKQREDICERYRVVPGAKTVVIQNGFELEPMSVEKRRELRYKLRLSDEQFAFLWAGRMVPIKDIHLLAETIQLAVSHVPEAVFLIAGDGEQKSELEQLLLACPNVRMLGWQKDMHALSCAADAAILTSRNEGTPTVLIEAMAARHPFVSTNVGGVEDLAVGPLLAIPGIGWRGENGFLSDRKASALLACIQQLVNDRAMAERMGAIGQEFVTNTFSAARLINDISVLYEELLTKRQKRGIQLSTEEDPVREQAMT